MTDLASYPILVTGASRGLGAALAEALAAPGRHIVAVARTTGGLEALDDRIKARGGQTTLAPMDVTIPEAMAQLADAIGARWGGLSLWVHAAIHAASLSPVAHADPKDMIKSVATNIGATATLIGLVAPLLEAGKGTAVFFDDRHAGEKFFGAYGATKAAQIALAQSWQRESERIGPRVLILTPDPMPTATRARFYPGEAREGLVTPAEMARRVIAAL